MLSSATAQPTNLTSHVGAEFFCRKIRALDSITIRPNAKVLVAGCGAGHEAALIQKRMSAEVTGVDVQNFLSPKFNQWPNFKFQVSNVSDLSFEDNYFDAVFYHHVIEHVDDPARSLRELSLVLKPKGWIFVGTPNRHRLVSCVGAYKQSTWEPTIANKFSDNVKDWKARIQGKFHNEFGAHAGFSRRELSELLAREFGKQRWVTKSYLQQKYEGHLFAPAVSLIASEPFCEVSAPSIYVFAQNK